MIDHDHGETIAVMHNRTKRPKKEIQATLDKMEEAGVVMQVEVKHSRNGTTTARWFTN